MNTHSGRRARTAAATGLAAALLAAAPGVATAAGENLPPLRPSTDTLTVDAAKTCSDEPVHVPRAPELRAVVEDPAEDNEGWETNGAGAEFELWWTGADGTEQRRTHTSGIVHSPVTQLWRTPSDLPADTVVSWHVRAVDDEGATSAWSDQTPGTTCRFVIDTVNPEPATVVSEQYPDDGGGWHGGVGVYGSFTFDSPSEDVVEYVYSFLGSVPGRVRPEEPGGPVTVRWMPEESKPYYLEVTAVDRAGRPSSRTTHWMRVAAGRAPVAHWTLADPAGADAAAAEAGPAARAEDGVVFGAPAPSRTGLTSTVSLDGRGNGYLTPDAPATDTAETFALSAWVRPAATDAPMTVASQDAADGTSAFTLGLRPTADGPATWAFRYGGTTLTGGSASAGGWAHLTGLYDTEDDTLRLYVNGEEVASETGVAPTSAPGAFQIGRARGDAGARWRGEIGDVRVWDRVVPRKEIERMGSRPAELVAAWDIERTDDGVIPDREGGEPLTLHGGAGFYTPDYDACFEDPECLEFPAGALDGDDHLALDGTGGHAATDGPVVDTADSYSVGLRVRFAATTPDRPMTVLSQGDADSDAFRVRYDPAASEWQLVVTHGGEPGAEETVVAGPGAPTSSSDEVIVVHDDSEGRITLYVGGEAVATAGFGASWSAPGPLQIGRGHTADGGWGEYFHGGADTVRVFSGALTASQVPSFAHLG
ncbi:LamG-like jellyroll fold domain-containing protein [Streptomyces sp. enrichment culture]|uniref:LamG domain-containing protein n=1 Tax=Streptomyces sp. enrichment culture TaxID=1795815 RepID=UPI003F55819A